MSLGEKHGAAEYTKNGIGDVNSGEKGSAARYNNGKVPLQYIPVEQLCMYLENRGGCETALLTTLGYFAAWQRGQRTASEVLSTLNPINIEEAAKVFEFGAKKYAEWNWTKGMPWSVVTASCLRHFWRIAVYNDAFDKDSKLSHWGHIACNLMMLVHYEDNYKEGDDRPKIWGDDDQFIDGFASLDACEKARWEKMMPCAHKWEDSTWCGNEEYGRTCVLCGREEEGVPGNYWLRGTKP